MIGFRKHVLETREPLLVDERRLTSPSATAGLR